MTCFPSLRGPAASLVFLAAWALPGWGQEITPAPRPVNPGSSVGHSQPSAPRVSPAPVAPDEDVPHSGWWAGVKHYLRETLIGVPDEFDRPPLGASVYANGQTEVANGEAARLVFYRYDFVDGTPQLNCRGLEKLHQVGELLPETFAPVVVEPTPYAPDLDTGRRMIVYNALSQGPFPIPLERVVVGPFTTHGMSGEEAVLIHDSLLRQARTAGSAGAGSGGPSGGFGGNGLIALPAQ